MCYDFSMQILNFWCSGDSLQNLEKKYEEEKRRAQHMVKYVFVYYTQILTVKEI